MNSHMLPAFLYHAFVSYRHTDRDQAIADRLQAGLHRFGRPLWKLRAVRLYRDRTNLDANPDLWAAIQKALDASSHFIVVASPAAAASPWVRRELDYWLSTRGQSGLLLVLSNGTLTWDTVAGRFDDNLSNALPDDMLGRFTTEPLWLDLTWLDDKASHATSSEPRFLDVVATLSATLQGRPKDEIAGDDVQQLRLRRRLVGGALTLISIGFVAAVVFAINFLEQRNEAQVQRAVAIQQRDAALLTQSKFLTDLTNQEVEKGNASLGILLAQEALPKNWSKWERPYYPPAATALYRAVAAEREVLTIGPAGKIATASVSDAVLSRDGAQVLVGTVNGSVELWDTTRRQRLATWPVASKPISRVAFGVTGHAFAAAGSNVYRIDTTSGKVERSIDLRAGSDEESDSDSTDLGRPQMTINQLWVSSDGKRIIVIHELTAQLWTEEASGFTAHPPVRLNSGLFYHYSFSRDGRLLATGDGQSNEVTVFDLDTGSASELKLADYQQDGGSFSATFDASGKRLLVGCGKTVILLDLKTKRQLANLTDHAGSVTIADFSPDGTRIVTGSEDGSIKLWSESDNFARPTWTAAGFVRGSVAFLDEGPPAAQEELQAQRLHDDFEYNVGHLIFDAEGKHILATSGDRTILVFEVESKMPVAKVKGHDSRIDKAAFSPNGTIALTVGRDGTARLWNTAPADLPMLHPGFASVMSVNMPAGLKTPIAIVKYHDNRCGPYARVWRIGTGEAIGPPVLPDDRFVEIGSISADGSTLVTGRPDRPLDVFDLASGSATRITPPAELGTIDCAIPGPGGREVLFTSELREKIVALPGAKPALAIASVDAVSGALASESNLWWALSGRADKSLKTLQGDLKLGFSDVSADGSRILVRQSDDNVALYNATTATLIRVFVRPSSEEATPADTKLPTVEPDADEVSFSDDGLSIIGATGQWVRIWSASDGRLLRTVTQATTGVKSLALGGPADKQVLAVANADGTVRLFGPTDDSEGTPLGNGFSEPVDLTISPDGRRAVIEASERSCGIVSQFWDLVENRRIGNLPESGTCSFRFRFSIDSAQVVGVVSDPDGIAVWESEGGSELVRHRSCLPDGIEMYDAEPTNVMANGFSDDQNYVYAGTLAGVVCVWRNPGAGSRLIQSANAIVSRSLTQAERVKFPVP